MENGACLRNCRRCSLSGEQAARDERPAGQVEDRTGREGRNRKSRQGHSQSRSSNVPSKAEGQRNWTELMQNLLPCRPRGNREKMEAWGGGKEADIVKSSVPPWNKPESEAMPRCCECLHRTPTNHPPTPAGSLSFYLSALWIMLYVFGLFHCKAVQM